MGVLDLETFERAATAAASLLAVCLSLLNLHLRRRDRRTRVGVRVRYEYRVGGRGGPRLHDRTQHGLYLGLGEFLRAHGLKYPDGKPVLRFALTNAGGQPVYLEAVRLVLRSGIRGCGRPLVVDLAGGDVLPRKLAAGTANLVHPGGGEPRELVPGGRAGYRVELVRLARVLEEHGHSGNVRLAVEAEDSLGVRHRRAFRLDTHLWSPEQDGR